MIFLNNNKKLTRLSLNSQHNFNFAHLGRGREGGEESKGGASILGPGRRGCTSQASMEELEDEGPVERIELMH